MKVVRLLLIFLLLFLSVDIVLAACTVSTTPVIFGPYNVLSSSPNNSTGTITFTCDESPPPNVTVSISESPNSGGFNPRKMRQAGGTDFLNYNLYIDATFTDIWGNGTSGTATITQKATKDKSITLTVYGKIPPEQDVSYGSYADTLTVTLNW